MVIVDSATGNIDFMCLFELVLSRYIPRSGIAGSYGSSVLVCLFVFCLSVFSRAAHMAYGGSQARDLIGATVTGHSHSHSNKRSKPHVRPTPELIATPDH